MSKLRSEERDALMNAIAAFLGCGTQLQELRGAITARIPDWRERIPGYFAIATELGIDAETIRSEVAARVKETEDAAMEKQRAKTEARGEIGSIYDASDGARTRKLYRKLDSIGPTGKLAHYLLAAQKTSSRAKQYRDRLGQISFRAAAYGAKQDAIDHLCDCLTITGFKWGWKSDPKVVFDQKPAYVLYIDLPNGQVSFHAPLRGNGPDYSKEWDGLHESEERIVMFAQSLFSIQS